MNARLVFACAATGLAMTFIGATTATANEANIGSIGFGEFDFAGRGESVEIMGTCDDPNFTTTPVVSDVLDMPDLHGTDDGVGGYHLMSFGTVRDDAKSGTWPVHFMCGTTRVETSFTVVAGVEPVIDDTSGTSDTALEVPVVAGNAPVAPVPVKPKGDTGAVETATVAPAADQGPSVGVLALGGLALLGTAGGLVVAYRKRQHS